MLDLLKIILSKRDGNPGPKQGMRVYSSRCQRRERNDILCHNCVKECPKEAIDLRGKVAILEEKCDCCGKCVEVCPSKVFQFPATEDNSQISRREFFKKLNIKGNRSDKE